MNPICQTKAVAPLLFDMLFLGIDVVATFPIIEAQTIGQGGENIFFLSNRKSTLLFSLTRLVNYLFVFSFNLKSKWFP